MARTVTDAAILLDALVGYDPADEFTTTYTIANFKGTYTDCLQAGGFEGARFGVIKEAFGSDDDPDCAPVNTVVRQAIDDMRRAGAEFVELSIPNLDGLIADSSLYISRSRFDVDNFLKSRPTIPYSSIEEIYREGKYDKKLELIPAIVEEGPAEPETDPEYFRRLARIYEFQRLLVGLIAREGLDGICYPCCRVLSPTHEDLRSGRWTVLTYPTNTVIASQSLLPSICLPAGFSESGVPIGMELIAPPYHEPELIRLGYRFEQLTRWRRPPESTPPL
jgi:Asp-tRNA(Asn)/Glu-tRNA(Gln) amidotransferase A subunit family amidase